MFDNIRSVGTAAMLLALTRNMQDEDTVKKMLAERDLEIEVMKEVAA